MLTRVYIAGAYSGSDVVTILNNMRRGMRAGVKVLLAGFAPFVPWFDYHFQLMLQDGEELDVNKYYAYSTAWLEASHVLYVLQGSEKSAGVQEEIAYATDRGIPVVYNMADLAQYKEAPKKVEGLDPKERKLYEDAIEQWGKPAQLAMVAEEASELAKVALGLIRGRGTMDELAGEMVDVLIMMDQLRVMFPDIDGLVKMGRAKKLSRLSDMLKEEQKGI